MSDQMPTIYLAEKGSAIGNLASNVSRLGFIETDHYLVSDLRRNAQAIIHEIDTWRNAPEPGPRSIIVGPMKGADHPDRLSDALADYEEGSE